MAALSGSFTSGVADTNFSSIPVGPTLSPGVILLGVYNITYYKMRGIDRDCATLVYRSWIVKNSPDFTGTLYSGPRCGVSNFGDIVVTDQWAFVVQN